MMRFVIIPETGVGKGTGHLVRSLDLAACLPGAEICLPASDLAELTERYPSLKSLQTIDLEGFMAEESGQGQCFIIIDRPLVSEPEILHLLHKGSVIGIDVVGAGLRRVPYIVDLLPRLRQNGSWQTANLEARHFLDLPPKRRDTPGPQNIQRVLVAFGGEDPAGLRKALIQSGVVTKYLPQAQISVLTGPRMQPLAIPLPENWQEIPPIARLRERIHEWDLVITSFGLTAYEARQVGCRVLVFNPAPYHDRLSRRDGFPSCGVAKVGQRAFKRALHSKRFAPLNLEGPGGGLPLGPRGLAQFLLGLKSPEACACPACSSRGNQVIARFADRSFYRCGNCGLDYQQLFGEQTIAYNEAYFFEEYQKQYGKTYLDDFDHIKAMGKSRLNSMARLGHLLPGERLLDIGCAYGPFLSAAKDRGLAVMGNDISPAAVAWVSANLGLPAIAGDIRQLTAQELGGQFNIISLWYVIEHFPDLGKILVKLNELLTIGGMLALATPSGSGVSGRFRPRQFLAASPRDHYSIWRPAQAARLLELFGFTLNKVVITGHHPERFPGIWGLRIFRPLMGLISRKFGLGDTFELYATKNRDLGPDFGQGRENP